MVRLSCRQSLINVTTYTVAEVRVGLTSRWIDIFDGVAVYRVARILPWGVSTFRMTRAALPSRMNLRIFTGESTMLKDDPSWLRRLSTYI